MKRSDGPLDAIICRPNRTRVVVTSAVVGGGGEKATRTAIGRWSRVVMITRDELGRETRFKICDMCKTPTLLITVRVLEYVRRDSFSYSTRVVEQRSSEVQRQQYVYKLMLLLLLIFSYYWWLCGNETKMKTRFSTLDIMCVINEIQK